MAIPHTLKTIAARLLRRPAVPSVPAVPAVTANTYLEPGNQWYLPPLAGASTLAPLIGGGRVVRQALTILERLTPDVYATFLRNFYAAGLSQYGDAWQYADINTALVGLAHALQPATYLEIGVRRGRSLAMLGSHAQACHIVACDMFQEGYAGMDNPGPDFVRAELQRIGFTGTLDFLIGDSHVLLPDYFRRHPDRYFDVITVDGDHSVAGARADLLTVMPRLKIGGALVFDDVSHQLHPELKHVWRDTVVARADFSSFTFDEIGFGTGVAIRHA